MVISARAGTPMAEIEATLAEHGQHIIAEPPDLSSLFGVARPQTLGGVIATNLSGPRRVAWGAMRDHLLGIRAVTGHGEIIRSGGRVLKNVTGLDLCKLLAGSHGTLGVITKVNLKVLPAPAAVGTVVLPDLDAVAGVAAQLILLGSPLVYPPPHGCRPPLPEYLHSPGRPLRRPHASKTASSVTYRTAKPSSPEPCRDRNIRRCAVARYGGPSATSNHWSQPTRCDLAPLSGHRPGPPC
jgi:hypothetical protein